MSLQIDKTDTKALKDFAVTMSWAFPLVFSALLPWLFSYSIHYWPFAISAILMTLYFVAPSAIYYPFRVWAVIGGVLGWINTRIILGLSFYILIAPIGILLRFIGKLQYRRKMPTNSSSNYRAPEAKSKKQSLEFPF